MAGRCPIPGHGLANAAALEDAGLAPWARTDEQFATALREQSGRGRTPQVQDDPTLHVLAVLRGVAATSSPRASRAPMLAFDASGRPARRDRPQRAEARLRRPA